MLRDVVADGEEEVLGEIWVDRGPLGHGPLDGTRRVRATELIQHGEPGRERDHLYWYTKLV